MIRQWYRKMFSQERAPVYKEAGLHVLQCLGQRLTDDGILS